MVEILIRNNVSLVQGLPPGFEPVLFEVCSYVQQQFEEDGWTAPGETQNWSGRIYLARQIPQGVVVPTGLLSYVRNALQFNSIPWTETDERQRPLSGPPDRGPIPLWDYQQEAVSAALKAGRGVIHLPPRGGKTRIGMEIHRSLSLPTVWTVPTSNLATQTLRVAQEFFGEKYAVHLEGSANVPRAPLTICTDATARLLPPDFFRNVEVLVQDECCPPGTVVGGRYISRIEVGDEVPSVDVETGQVHFLPVSQVFRSQAEFLVRVKHLRGVAYFTPKHPIWAQKKGAPGFAWVPAGELSSGDLLLSVNEWRKKTPPTPVHFRVTSVMTLRRGDAEFEEVCPGGTVYNLEVPGTHTYVADRIVVHNCHHAASATGHQLLAKCDHVFHRFGLTGTFFRSGDDLLALHAVHSEVVYRITPSQLAARGFLVPTDVFFLPMDCPRVSGGPRFQTGAGLRGIFDHQYRTELAAWAAAVLHHRGKRVVALVAQKRQGEALQELLQEMLGRGPNKLGLVEFVSTSRPPHVCRQVIDAFTSGQGPQILIGTSMIGEGCDLPNADALVYAAGGKAEVAHTQAAYRVCTAAPGKSRAVIVDFADRHHPQLLAHSEERMDTYLKGEIFRPRVLPDPGELARLV